MRTTHGGITGDTYDLCLRGLVVSMSEEETRSLIAELNNRIRLTRREALRKKAREELDRKYPPESITKSIVEQQYEQAMTSLMSKLADAIYEGSRNG